MSRQYAEWKIKNPEHNNCHDMWDTVQIWPSFKDVMQISFSVVSTPGNVQHTLWMSLEDAREFANYLLQSCDKVDYVNEERTKYLEKHPWKT